MSANIGQSYTLTPEPPAIAETAVTTDDGLLGPTAQAQAWKDAWEAVIDRKLIEWGRAPAQLEEDDLIPPSDAALHRAIRIAQEMMKFGGQPPKRVVPDGNGGIDFERRSGSVVVSIEVDGTGRAEIVTLEDRRVVVRREFLLGL